MILCVTGPMAAGKNAASALLENKGFLSIDADILVHNILKEPAIQEKVIETFSEEAKKQNIELSNADGTLNRRNLGAIIFKDKKLLEKQENIVLPEVESRLRLFIEQNKGKNIILNATVLYKIPIIKECNAVLFVTAPLLVRLKRAKKRDGIKTVHILRRFWSQRNLFSKYKNSNADTVKVYNIGNLKMLETNIMEFLKAYTF